VNDIRSSLIVVAAAAVGIIAVAACDGRRQADRGADASSSGVTATAGGLSPDVRAVCDTVAARWHAVRDARVEARDSTVVPINRNSIRQGQPDELLPATPACVVAMGIDSGKAESPKGYWPASDWTELWIINADGPGSRMQNFQRDLVRCQVSSESDAGDETDSVAVPSPSFSETTVCWHHPRRIIASDTGRPP